MDIKTFFHSAILLLLFLLFSNCQLSAQEKNGWTELFNGEDLEGWIQRGGDAKYFVEDGVIVGETVPDTPNAFLCTVNHYCNFVLEFEVRVDRDLNSGVQIRSNSYEDYKNGRVHGYQVEIDPSPRAYSGGIYDEARRGWLFDLQGYDEAREAFNNEGWNHFRVEARGSHIRTWVNDVEVADLRDDMTACGFIGLQVHSTNHDKPLQVRWRNIRIKSVGAE